MFLCLIMERSRSPGGKFSSRLFAEVPLAPQRLNRFLHLHQYASSSRGFTMPPGDHYMTDTEETILHTIPWKKHNSENILHNNKPRPPSLRSDFPLMIPQHPQTQRVELLSPLCVSAAALFPQHLPFPPLMSSAFCYLADMSEPGIQITSGRA